MAGKTGRVPRPCSVTGEHRLERGPRGPRLRQWRCLGKVPLKGGPGRSAAAVAQAPENASRYCFAIASAVAAAPSAAAGGVFPSATAAGTPALLVPATLPALPMPILPPPGQLRRCRVCRLRAATAASRSSLCSVHVSGTGSELRQQPLPLPSSAPRWT